MTVRSAGHTVLASADSDVLRLAPQASQLPRRALRDGPGAAARGSAQEPGDLASRRQIVPIQSS